MHPTTWYLTCLSAQVRRSLNTGEQRTGVGAARRLELGAAILSAIQRKRAELGDPTFGALMERRIIDGELGDLLRASVTAPAVEGGLDG